MQLIEYHDKYMKLGEIPIEELHRIRPYGGIIPQRRAEALDVAIKALEEVQQYHQIGTVEECREAVEKQTAKKPVSVLKKLM